MGSWLLLGAERRDRATAGMQVPTEGAAEVRPPMFTPRGRQPAGVGVSLDWTGAALLAALLTSLLIPLISVPFWGWRSPLTLGLLGGFAALLVAFVLVEDRVRDPCST